MKDGFIRRFIKKIALARYLFDLKTTRLIKHLSGEPKYRLEGLCNGCGLCCEKPTIPAHPIFFYMKTARWLLLTWHQVINGFEYKGEERKNRLFIFHCTHYDPVTKLCDSYESRPGMCRDYPRNLIYETNPEFFSECGLYAVDKRANQFKEALKQANLSPEKIEQLQKKLHLKE